jgi:hypothetical protein
VVRTLENISLFCTFSCLNIYTSIKTIGATYLKEFIPIDDAIAVLVNLGQKSRNLLIGNITLPEILEDLLELLGIHGPVLVSIINLESVGQL